MDLRLVMRLTVGLVAGAAIAWIAALLLTLPSGNVVTTVVIRTVLILTMIVILTRHFVRRAYDGPTVGRSVALAAVLSYLAFPVTWVGRALAGQLALDPGLLSAAVDLVLWVGVVLLAGRSVSPRAALPSYLAPPSEPTLDR